MKHPIYHTKRFWKTFQPQFASKHVEFYCQASSDFRDLWNYNEDFHNYVCSHARTFLALQTPEFAHNVTTIDCDVVFNACGRNREVRLAFLKYMVKTISLRTIKSL